MTTGMVQPLMTEIGPRTWDVIVLGAGPAGSVAASLLAGRGWNVLLVDKMRFPREKVCGDGLIADAVNCMRRIGVLEVIDRYAFKTDRSAVFSPSRYEVEVHGDYRTLKRAIFDDLLARAAVERGAAFALGHAESVVQTAEDCVEVRFKDAVDPVRARIAIVSTGVDVSLLEPLGMVQRATPSAVAVRMYVKSLQPLDRMIVSYDRSIVPGYAWIFPMGHDEFNVGCGIFYGRQDRHHWNLRRMLDLFLREFPIAKALMSRSSFASPLRGATLRCGLEGTSLHGGGTILAVGETTGATFPFTGEGIGKAMETAELAGDIVDEALRHGDMSLLGRFPAVVNERLLPRYQGYRIAENWLSIPWLNDLVARRAQRSVFMRHAMEGIVNETEDPRTVFSLRGLLKSFWG